MPVLHSDDPFHRGDISCTNHFKTWTVHFIRFKYAHCDYPWAWLPSVVVTSLGIFFRILTDRRWRWSLYPLVLFQRYSVKVLNIQEGFFDVLQSVRGTQKTFIIPKNQCNKLCILGYSTDKYFSSQSDSHRLWHDALRKIPHRLSILSQPPPVVVAIGDARFLNARINFTQCFS